MLGRRYLGHQSIRERISTQLKGKRPLGCATPGDYAKVLTQFEVFLGDCEQLRYSRRKRFIVNDNATPERVLTDKETEDIDKVGKEGNIMNRKVINYRFVSLADFNKCDK